MAPNSNTMKQLLGKARDAKRGGRDAWSVQSTGEKLAVALVLNRADWLASMGYTIAEAIGRLEGDWLACIPTAERTLHDEDVQAADEADQ